MRIMYNVMIVDELNCILQISFELSVNATMVWENCCQNTKITHFCRCRM